MREEGTGERERRSAMRDNEGACVVRVGVVGCGVVGSAFATALRRRRRAIAQRYGIFLELVEGAVARPAIPRPSLDGVPVHGDGAMLAERTDLDVIVEASSAPRAGEWF